MERERLTEKISIAIFRNEKRIITVYIRLLTII